MLIMLDKCKVNMIVPSSPGTLTLKVELKLEGQKCKAYTNISSPPIVPISKVDLSLKERKLAKLWQARLGHLNFNSLFQASR